MNAIVYTSNSGFTAQYAEMPGGKLGLPACFAFAGHRDFHDEGASHGADSDRWNLNKASILQRSK
jgi:hypothetical protein